MELQHLAVWTDGGARGNPGPSAIGVRVASVMAGSTDQYQTIGEVSQYIGETTNNQAEYRALKAALSWLKEYTIVQKIDPKQLEIDFYTDSELMAYQVQGRYKVKNAELRPLYEEIVAQLQAFKTYRITPVRREFNKVADGLVNKALDALSTK